MSEKLTTIPHYVKADTADELMASMANLQQKANIKFAFSVSVLPDGKFIAWYEDDLVRSAREGMNENN